LIIRIIVREKFLEGVQKEEEVMIPDYGIYFKRRKMK